MATLMTMAEWLDRWTEQAPLLPGDRLRDRLDGFEESTPKISTTKISMRRKGSA
ncbi:hypothetical protein [Streptomyces viridochromogenes]|uniref:hypothetical protein n=1 Tax=Streptomyces viridochromogenes TaxID=1938 RepID=UPI000A51B3D5|nr:hypothetical protein [Streptomyces viridochromogenes]